MNPLEQTFQFSQEELIKNRSGFLSDSQILKINKLEKLKTFFSFFLCILFLIISAFFLYSYSLSLSNDPSVLPKTKYGEPISGLFFVILGSIGFLLSAFFGSTTWILKKRIKTLFDEDSVKTVDAYIESIDYQNKDHKFPFLKVNDLILKNIFSYHPNIFQPMLKYRFYYSKFSHSLLSIEILSEEYVSRFE